MMFIDCLPTTSAPYIPYLPFNPSGGPYMAEQRLHFENFSGARNVQLGQQTVNLIAGNLNQYLSNENGQYNVGIVYGSSC